MPDVDRGVHVRGQARVRLLREILHREQRDHAAADLLGAPVRVVGEAIDVMPRPTSALDATRTSRPP